MNDSPNPSKAWLTAKKRRNRVALYLSDAEYAAFRRLSFERHQPMTEILLDLLLPQLPQKPSEESS